MVKIKLWDYEPINTSSQEIKNEISQSISDYILNHWDGCVHITPTESDEKHEVEFSITL